MGVAASCPRFHFSPLAWNQSPTSRLLSVSTARGLLPHCLCAYLVCAGSFWHLQLSEAQLGLQFLFSRGFFDLPGLRCPAFLTSPGSMFLWLGLGILPSQKTPLLPDSCLSCLPFVVQVTPSLEVFTLLTKPCPGIFLFIFWNCPRKTPVVPLWVFVFAPTLLTLRCYFLRSWPAEVAIGILFSRCPIITLSNTGGREEGLPEELGPRPLHERPLLLIWHYDSDRTLSHQKTSWLLFRKPALGVVLLQLPDTGYDGFQFMPEPKIVL